MTTMEFDEMKKIWDSQNHELIYGINEKALHNRILSKKRQAHHITNFTEVLLIVVNIAVGCLILSLNFIKQNNNIFMYLMCAWMLAVALFLILSRIHRIKENQRHDRSIHGELSHAISLATYQVRLSKLMRWNALPLGVLIILGVWDGEKSIWFALGIFIFFVLANYAAGWEHGIYESRKHELEILQHKLECEKPSDLDTPA